jgi:hypothetical protein
MEVWKNGSACAKFLKVKYERSMKDVEIEF